MSKWPSFVTKDLDPDDDAEFMRRWRAYEREMKALIAQGGFHQDDDGWWIETATGELVGPDPEIERPLSDADWDNAKSLDETLPELAGAIKRSRGRPRVANPKQAVTLRVDPAVVEHFKAQGKQWRSDMAEALKKAAHLD